MDWRVAKHIPRLLKCSLRHRGYSFSKNATCSEERAHTYRRVRNVCFSKSMANLLNQWSHIDLHRQIPSLPLLLQNHLYYSFLHTWIRDILARWITQNWQYDNCQYILHDESILTELSMALIGYSNVYFFLDWMLFKYTCHDSYKEKMNNTKNKIEINLDPAFPCLTF